MRRVYGILPWGIVALGVLHMAATFRVSSAFNASALWFFSAGIAWVLTGALNLLNRAYGQDAPGLLWFCRGNNVFILCFTALSGVVTNASASGLAMIVGLFAVVTILSWMRSSLGHARAWSPADGRTAKSQRAREELPADTG